MTVRTAPALGRFFQHSSPNPRATSVVASFEVDGQANQRMRLAEIDLDVPSRRHAFPQAALDRRGIQRLIDLDA